MTRRFCLFLFSGAAWAQIARPRIGFFVDREGNLRALEGVAGAFTVSRALEQGVISAAYSGETLVTKTAHHVRVGDRSYDAPSGPATVVFDNSGQPAEIFFPDAKILWTWQSGEFISAPAHDVIADVYIRRGELISKGVPVRLASEAKYVSQLGPGWMVVYSDDRLYAIRGMQTYEVPEGNDE
jgi:hypothetical protein